MELFISNRYKVINILKPTQAKVFKNVEIGDVIDISLPLNERTAHSRRGTYKLTFCVTNMTTGEQDNKYINQLAKCLECFEWDFYKEER